MKINNRHIAALSIALFAAVALSIFNTYKGYNLEHRLTETAQKTAVDAAVGTVQSQILDLRTRIDHLESAPKEDPDTVPTSTQNIFEKEKVRVGDTIVGMTITSLTNRYTSFRGRVTVRGDVTVNSSEEFLGKGLTSFSVAEEDWNKIPRILNDHRRVWFVFSNKIPANTFKQSGPATITIDRYTIDSNQGEVANTAELVTVER